MSKKKISSFAEILFRNLFSSILTGLVFAGLFSAVFYVLALPYAPGETINPTCSPTDTNCTVTSAVPYTGATAALDIGARNFTTTGTGGFGALTASSLTLTTSALTVGNGGTGLSSIALGSILGANTLSTLTAITSTSGTKYLQNADGAISWSASLTASGGIITPKIYPASDSTTAVQINKADGTTNVLNVDTTNSRVGIGTTAPGATLEVRNGYYATLGYHGADEYIFKGGWSTSERVGITVNAGNDWGASYGGASAGIRLGTGSAYSYIVGNGTNLLLNPNTGNVGIGTTAPGAKLDVSNGDIYLSSYGKGVYFHYALGTYSTNEPRIGTGMIEAQYDRAFTIQQPSGNNEAFINFMTGTTTRMVIGSNYEGGNVGIGPDYSPDYFFDVQGAMNVDGATYLATTSGNVGIGTTSPDRLLHPELSDATTNAVTYPLRLTHVTTGTPANSIGAGLEFEVETAANNNEVGAIIEAVATDTTATSEDFDIVFKNMAAGAAAAETMRISSAGVLTVAGAQTFTGNGTFSGNLTVDGNTTLGSGTEDSITVNADAITIANDTDVTLTGGVNGLSFDAGTLSIDSTNDRVGIGTTAPGATLEVNGSTKFWHGGTAYYTMFQTSNELNTYTSAGVASTLYIQYPAAAHNTNIGRGALYITGNTGNVGINDTSPDGLLDVDVSGAANALVVNATTGNVGIGTASPGDNLHITADDATTNAVVDVLRVEHTTTGTAAANIGVGQVFYAEDAGGTEEQASLDVVLTDITDAAEEADFVFSQNTGGAIKETLRLIAAETATTSDQLQFTSNTDETDGIVDSLVFKLDSTGTPAANLGMGMSFQLDDAGGIEEQASIDVQLTTVTDAAEDADMIFNVNKAGTMTEIMRIDGSAGNVGIGTTAPGAKLDVNNTGTGNGISITQSGILASGKNALQVSGSGYVLRGQSLVKFTAGDASDWSPVLELVGQQQTLTITQGYVGDAVILTHSGATGIGMNIDRDGNSASAITGLWVNAANAGAGAAYAAIFEAGNVGIGTTSPDRLLHAESSTALTNTVSYAQRLSHITSGVPANSIGVGLEFEQETAADNNEVGAIIEAVATDTTATSEDFDLVFKNMAAGAAATEKMRITSAGSIVLGTAALATNATDGFLYIPSSAGAPTGTPTTQTGTVPIQYDTTNNRIYAYRGGAWRYFAETGGFQIPDFETADPISGEKIKEGDIVLGIVDSTMSDSALHAKWATWNSVKSLLLKETRGELSSSGSFGTGGVVGVETETFLDKVKNTLYSFGITFADGITNIKNLAAEKFSAQKAEIKTASVENLQMTAANGEVYCVGIDANGEWVKIKGECGNAAVAVAQPQDVRPPENLSQSSVEVGPLPAPAAAEQTTQQAQEVIQQAASAAANAADKTAKEAVKEMKEEIKQEVKQELQNENPNDQIPNSNQPPNPNIQNETTLPASEPAIEEQQPAPEPEQPSVGDLMQDAAAGLLNAIWEFMNGMFKLGVEKFSALPFMKNMTASVLRNSEELKEGLPSTRVQTFTANLFGPIDNLLGRLFGK